MDDLVAFLKARYDEDEQMARAVRVPPEWHQGPGDDPEWTDEETVCMWPPEFHTPYERDKHWRGLTVEGPELAAHIARHDPARVLRDIAAKRQIVDEHQPGPGWDGRITPEHPHREPVCTTCADYDRNGDPTGDPYPCATLRQLAAVYADHPSYRESWRP